MNEQSDLDRWIQIAANFQHEVGVAKNEVARLTAQRDRLRESVQDSYRGLGPMNPYLSKEDEMSWLRWIEAEDYNLHPDDMTD